MFAQVALTPIGKPVAAPMPVAPVVVKVISGDKVVFIQSEGLEEATVVVLFGVTVIVPVALTVPHPPVRGMV